MQRALAEYVVKGITTNIRYLQRDPRRTRSSSSGDYDTGFLGREHAGAAGRATTRSSTEVALLAAVVYAHQRDQKRAKTLPQAPASGGTGGIAAWRLREPPRGR